MEMMMRNFATAATKVQVSLILGLFLLSIKRGTAQIDTKTAIRGFIEIIDSIYSLTHNHNLTHNQTSLKRTIKEYDYDYE